MGQEEGCFPLLPSLRVDSRFERIREGRMHQGFIGWVISVEVLDLEVLRVLRFLTDWKFWRAVRNL